MTALCPPAWVADYVGLPFRARGRDRLGCDCWGLATLVYRERLGVALEPHALLSTADAAGALAAIAAEQRSGHWVEVDATAADAYDLAICAAAVDRRIADLHLGVVAGPGWLLHTESDAAGAVCVRIETLGARVREYWRRV